MFGVINKKNKNLFFKFVLILFFFSIVFVFVFFDLGQYLTLDFIKESQEDFNNYYDEHPFLIIGLFFIVYVIVTTVSIPGAAVITMVAGALFGLVLGTIIVSFASTIGATLAMLSSRFLFRDFIEKNFEKRIKKINSGVEKEGNFYLFTLRLVPLVPFFMVNFGMGLTKIRIWPYIWVSQLGMLAGTIVYVNAGMQLANIESVRDILSIEIILSFVLIGLFPILAKKAIEFYKGKKIKN